MTLFNPLRLLARSVLGLPTRALLVASGGATRIDGNTLDPQIQVLVRLSSLVRLPKLETQPLAEGRAGFVEQMAIVDMPLAPGVSAEGRLIDGPGGVLPLRIYRPEGLGPQAPCLVYFHGGGFVVGDLNSHDRPCRWLAREARAVVIAVDYRLAPEHPFPAAVDDAMAAYRWVHERRGALGVGPIGVAGDSAGGNLAAVVAQQTRGLDLAPRLQFLIYPVTEFGSRLPSRQTFASGFFLEKTTMDWFTDQYLPDEARWRDLRASPIHAPDLAGLPPALVVTAGYDPLRDEGRLYADRLQEAGVPVRYRCAAGLVHGFWSMGGLIREAREQMLRLSREAGDMLREAR